MAYKKVCGIYTITHKSSGRVYVGSALNIKQRWAYHRWCFKHDKGGNPYLKNAWDKYGPEEFEFSIVEVVDDENDMLKREQYWIDKLDACNRNKGFNIAPNAGNTLGTKRSKEAIRKTAMANRGMSRSEETKKKMSEAAMGNTNGAGSHYHGVLERKHILPIFRSVAGSKTVDDVAEEYSVSSATIRRIINRTTWWSVPIPDKLVKKAQHEKDMRRTRTLRKSAKLNKEQVKQIKRLIKRGETAPAIASKFPVTAPTIYAIKHGRCWKDVTID